MEYITILATFLSIFLTTAKGCRKCSVRNAPEFLQITSKAIDRDTNIDPASILHITSIDNLKIADQKVGSMLRKKMWNYSKESLTSDASNFYRKLIDNEKHNFSKICENGERDLN